MLKHALLLSPILLLYACGTASKATTNGPEDPGDPNLKLRSFDIIGSDNALGTTSQPASIQLAQGTKFQLSWHITADLPMYIRVYASNTAEADSKSAQIYTRNCDFLSNSQCKEWKASITCEMKEDKKVVCGDNTIPSIVDLSALVEGSASQYLILETCALFTCETASNPVRMK